MRSLTVIFLLINSLGLLGQTKEPINFGTATHPFEVYSIKHTKENTIVELALTNQMTGGYFCADKKIFLSNAETGYEILMKRSEGIPTCPDVYRFRDVGEKLVFKLYFDKVPEDLAIFDIVEACNENCFRISGIINDEEMNRQINESYRLFASKKAAEALALTEKIVEAHPDYMYAFLQFNLIHYAATIGDFEKAKQHFESFQKKSFYDKKNTLSRLQAMEYYMKIK